MKPVYYELMELAYKDLQKYLDKYETTRAHFQSVKDIITSLEDSLNSQSGAALNRADRKNVVQGIEKFEKLLSKIKKRLDTRHEEIQKLIETGLPRSRQALHDLCTRSQSRDLIKNMEKRLQMLGFSGRYDGIIDKKFSEPTLDPQSQEMDIPPHKVRLFTIGH